MLSHPHWSPYHDVHPPIRVRVRVDYHPKGLEPKGLDPKGLEPKGSRVTHMGFMSGSPETVLQPQWSMFLVCTSFLSPKGAGLWTVDWQFQKSGFPQLTKPMGDAMCSCPQLPRRMVCLTCIVYLLCLPGVHSISELSKPPPLAWLSLLMPGVLVLSHHTSDAH